MTDPTCLRSSDLRLLLDARAAVAQAEHTAAFVQRHIERTYALREGDQVTATGEIVRVVQNA